VADLNRFYREHGFLPQSDYDFKSFQWVNSNDGNNSVISFVRYGTRPDEVLLVVANMTPVTRESYRVGVPCDGLWTEVLNTDSPKYGGDGVGNPSGVKAQAIQWDGRPFAVDLVLPGMSVLFFLPEKKAETATAETTAKPKKKP